jgi:polysaccharide pyruvyl transferase WcaK-like protein
LADYRSYRDTGSRDFMESAGVDTKRDAMYPDLAFKLPVPQSDAAKPLRPAHCRRRGDELSRLVRIREARAGRFETYVAKMAKFVRTLLDGGYRVRLLTGDEEDAPAVGAIVSALGGTDAGRLSQEPVHSIHDVIGQVSGTDLVVATRFHNVVAALMAGKPVISLGYAAKNDLLLGKMGLGEFCQDVDCFDVGLLSEQFAKLAGNHEEHARTVACKVGKFRKASNSRTNSCCRPSFEHLRKD